MKKLLPLFAVALLLNTTAYAQPSINDPFFDHVDFIGAFGTTNWTAGWCNWNPQMTMYPTPTVTIPAGDITTNTTWTNNNTYLLNGWVYVKSGATLTIQAGTVIRGDYNNKGSLIIEPGAQLIAIGTPSQPIVFTSNEDAGFRDYGDWGGVILCGYAAINQPGGTAQIEGGPTTIYGGGSSPNNNDNSGTLQYVRIEFAGVPFVQDKEINGLTMAGVGSGTTIDHIQVSYCGDDAFEWFGGTVNAKYLVSFRNWDDDFDTDNGWQGRVQYAVALRDPNIADPGSKSNGFESDNDASGSTNTPQTSGVFSNVSMFGPKVNPGDAINTNYKCGLHLRRNTALKIYNSVFAGYKDGLLLDGAATEANATAGLLRMEYCIIAGTSGSEFLVASGSTFNLADWFLNTMTCNDTLKTNAELGITDPFNLTSPNFLPTAGSRLLNRTWLDCYASAGEISESLHSFSIYPNPAQDKANISFSLTENENIKIELSDITGRTVRTLHNGITSAGEHELSINISDLSSGIWLVRFISPETSQTQRLLITR